MAVKYVCDRCDEPGITTHKFASGVDVVVMQQAPGPTHLCLNCLGEALLAAVNSLADTPCARDLNETKKRAAECSRAHAAVERVTEERDTLKEKLHEARNQATESSRYDVWLAERADLLQQIDALKAERDVAQAQTQTAQRTLADRAKAAAAAAEQSKHEDPAYLAAVAKREARRAGGNA